MRELTKSLMSASWAMSLLSMKEGMALFNPQTWDPSPKGKANGFQPVAEAAASQLDSSLQGLFRTGDNFQRGMVNLMFGFFDSGNWNPGRWAPGTGSTSPCGGNQSGQSWGPIPPRYDGQ
jgi:hypothetical protein